jgi:ATP/ADP translocase
MATIFPSWILLQFAWKDIYILLMLKQVWSLIHSTILPGKAKFLYGLIYGVGTLGSIAGSLLPGLFAVKIGSERLFFFTLPLYVLLMYAYGKAFSHSKYVPTETKQTQDTGAFSMIANSPYLICVLLLVVFMQITVGLMEYQFNANLELSIIEKDLRTQYVGQMMTYVNLLSGFFQLVGSFLLVQFLGVRGSHLVVPLLLLVNASALIYFPSFGLISFAFIFIKSVDFSLFGVVREMLYIPMKQDEKYRAKAVIDVFAYRSSKALVSACILGLQFFSGTNLLPLASRLGVVILFIWLLTVWFMLRKHYPKDVMIASGNKS